MNHPFFRWRLIACIILSLFVHLVILALPIVYRVQGSANEPSFGREGQLQIRLQVEANDSLVEMLQSSGGEDDKRDQSIGKKREAKPGLFLVEQDQLPEPLSDIDFGIDDPRVVGLMILSLQIDSLGNVGSVEVVYADIPQEQREKIVRGFSSARFKPGTKGGVPVATTILLRVDIE